MKSAVSRRLKHISWYLFRGVYNHLLVKYQRILGAEQMKYLGHFKEAFAIDGSVVALCKKMAQIFESVHQGQASLKLNTKFSLKIGAVTKLQVSRGKRHDSRFAFVTKMPNLLYIVDLGFWSLSKTCWLWRISSPKTRMALWLRSIPPLFFISLP